ncbi:hypothetical protein [Panacagrimonas perspica]|nr:hypothetical protein [Panacagrimonas perspica]
MRMKVSNVASAILGATLLLASGGSAIAQAVPPESSAQDMLPPPQASTGASGAAPLPTMSESFADLDRDKDGALTPSEADRNQNVAMAFKRLDASHDGTLDLAEFAQLRRYNN